MHPSLHPDGGWLGGGRGETLFQYGRQCPIIMVAAARPLTCGPWPVACGLWPVACGLWFAGGRSEVRLLDDPGRSVRLVDSPNAAVGTTP